MENKSLCSLTPITSLHIFLWIRRTWTCKHIPIYPEIYQMAFQGDDGLDSLRSRSQAGRLVRLPGRSDWQRDGSRLPHVDEMLRTGNQSVRASYDTIILPRLMFDITTWQSKINRRVPPVSGHFGKGVCFSGFNSYSRWDSLQVP